jgi:hypothetical protein
MDAVLRPLVWGTSQMRECAPVRIRLFVSHPLTAVPQHHLSTNGLRPRRISGCSASSIQGHLTSTPMRSSTYPLIRSAEGDPLPAVSRMRLLLDASVNQGLASSSLGVFVLTLRANSAEQQIVKALSLCYTMPGHHCPLPRRATRKDGARRFVGACPHHSQGVKR